MEGDAAVVALGEDAVQDDDVEVEVGVEGGAEAVEEGDGAEPGRRPERTGWRGAAWCGWHGAGRGAAVPGLSGIFLIHAHVGHYAGLIHLGREILGARDVPVYAMCRCMRCTVIRLNERLTVMPFRVPHRDEYSETVGFRIAGARRTVIFLPDIDNWERWEADGTRIEDVVSDVDVAYLDATFYADGEVPGRAMSEIPHPLVVETMRRFADADAAERAKIRFIHLNRTHPALFGEDRDPSLAAPRAQGSVGLGCRNCTTKGARAV